MHTTTNVLSYLEKSAKKTPRVTAVIHKHTSLTYAELLELSKRIGTALLNKGVRGRAVVVAMEKSCETLATMMGALYTGGYYVPIDPSVPEKRMERILDALGTIYRMRDDELSRTSGGNRAVRHRWKVKARVLLAVGVLVNMGMLAALKYAGFFVSTLQELGMGDGISVPDIGAPIGISFYTFMAVSYLVDVYHETVEPVAQRVASRLGIDCESGWYRTLRIVRTLFIIFVGELVFRAADARSAFEMLGGIATRFSLNAFTNGDVLSLGLDVYDFRAVGVGVACVFALDLYKERGGTPRNAITSKGAFVRWTVWILIFTAIVVFGAYGYGYTPVDPMYAKF